MAALSRGANRVGPDRLTEREEGGECQHGVYCSWQGRDVDGTHRTCGRQFM